VVSALLDRGQVQGDAGHAAGTLHLEGTLTMSKVDGWTYGLYELVVRPAFTMNRSNSRIS
jgi:hypothetical protein